MAKIFFSYATEERLRLQRFIDAFRAYDDLEVLTDYGQIGISKSIPDGINRMIKESAGAVLFYSSTYARKPWTSEEQNALVYRSLSRDYRLAVVRLDEEELPPLLAHRLWLDASDGDALARAFSSRPRGGNGPGGASDEIADWLVIMQGHDLESLGTAIVQALEATPGATTLQWRTRRLGTLAIRLAQPTIRRLMDDLATVLRLMKSTSFIIGRLRERIDEGGLAVFEPPFELELERRESGLLSYQHELETLLDAIVERVDRA
jgi:hypothetical protein